MGDLLASDMVREFIFEVLDLVEELEGVEVVRDVPSSESKLAGLGIKLFGLRLCDLGVLDHAILALTESDDADGFSGAGFWYDLGGTVGLFVDAVANEDGIRDLYETVVDAVAVDILDLSCGEIGEDGSSGVFWFGRDWSTESGVETTVTVWGNGDTGFGIKENLSIHRQARERPCGYDVSGNRLNDSLSQTLLKQDDVRWVESEIRILLEKLLRVWTGGTTGHHIPRDDGGSLLLPKLGFCNGL